jgi:hypothetical protein
VRAPASAVAFVHHDPSSPLIHTAAAILHTSAVARQPPSSITFHNASMRIENALFGFRLGSFRSQVCALFHNGTSHPGHKQRQQYSGNAKNPKAIEIRQGKGLL